MTTPSLCLASLAIALAVQVGCQEPQSQGSAAGDVVFDDGDSDGGDLVSGDDQSGDAVQAGDSGSTGAGDQLASGDVSGPTSPPIRVIYAVHVHVSDDRLPYVKVGPAGCSSTDMGDCTLDEAKAQNMLDTIEAIWAEAEDHGAKISWQIAIGPAKGLCEYEQSKPLNIFQRLRAAGHEVAIHAHDPADVASLLGHINDCGIDDITTASGYAVWFDSTGLPLAAAMSSQIEELVAMGIRQGTTNIAPKADETHAMAPVCTTSWGIANNSWEEGTGNLMYPWRPNTAENKPCEHDPQGEFLWIDHTGPDWLITEAGKADIVQDAHFEQLKVEFDAAVEYRIGHPNQRIPVWGFVTHITEYAIGSKADAAPHGPSIEALGSFLDVVDEAISEGYAVYSTPEQIEAEY